MSVCDHQSSAAVKIAFRKTVLSQDGIPSMALCLLSFPGAFSRLREIHKTVRNLSATTFGGINPGDKGSPDPLP
jgi:hypothetical protein